MNETSNHPEQRRRSLSWSVWEWNSYQALRDQYQILREQRETLMDHHRAMVEQDTGPGLPKISGRSDRGRTPRRSARPENFEDSRPLLTGKCDVGQACRGR